MKSPRLFALALCALFGSACAAENQRTLLFAQRGGPPTCTDDASCVGKIRLPRARRCANGSPNTPSLCCRMGYCGICWSECGR